jgi:hypothetical protein
MDCWLMPAIGHGQVWRLLTDYTWAKFESCCAHLQNSENVSLFEEGTYFNLFKKKNTRKE